MAKDKRDRPDPGPIDPTPDDDEILDGIWDRIAKDDADDDDDDE